MRTFLPSLFLGVIGTGLVAAALLTPKPGASVLHVFPPGTTDSEALVRVLEAGWLPIATPRPFVVLAAPADAARPPRGAWMTLDALGARGCQ